MKIKMKNKNKIWTAVIDGPIKSGMEFELADKLETVLHEEGVPKLIVDMKSVPYINSAALGIFLNVYREIEKQNGRFALSSISTDVDNLLDITKLESVFEIFKTSDDAQDSFKD